MEEKLPGQKLNKKQVLWIFLGVLVLLLITGAAAYSRWVGPKNAKPTAAASGLSTTPSPDPWQGNAEAFKGFSNLPPIPTFGFTAASTEAQPVCGKEKDWVILLVGIDYRGESYLYGLADVIRIVRVDFVNMTVNMIALPRDLIVEAPEGRFKVPDPYKINQAYLFGTPGLGHFTGSGYGAGALAEVIEHNFDLSIDHYGVINFLTFSHFINAIGGIEVDLPGPVNENLTGGFPAGKQKLNGERALALARIRHNYGDAFRVTNQTIIMRAMLSEMMKPTNLTRLTILLDYFKEAFLSDLSIEQIGTVGGCFLLNFDSDNLTTNNVPGDLLTGERAFIPSLNRNSFVYAWDEALVEWMHLALFGE